MVLEQHTKNRSRPKEGTSEGLSLSLVRYLTVVADRVARAVSRALCQGRKASSTFRGLVECIDPEYKNSKFCIACVRFEAASIHAIAVLEAFLCV